MLLDKTASVWRFVSNAGANPGSTNTQVYPAVKCAIVPISSFDAVVPYARDSTHVLWVPYWLSLRREDEVRYGALLDVAGNRIAQVYVVNGRRRFSIGTSQTAFYVREKE